MNADSLVKNEPVDSSRSQHQPLLFLCESCDIRFSNRNTLDAHRQHYCPKRQPASRQPADLPICSVAQSMKRKCSDISESSPTKRLSLLSHDSYCQECYLLADRREFFLPHLSRHCPRRPSDSKLNNRCASLTHPVPIGKFIYVPIPIRPTQVAADNPDSRPLDLSKPKHSRDDCRRSIVSPNAPVDLSPDRGKRTAHEQSHQCEFCSVHFRSLKTLRAHRDIYCGAHRKPRKHEDTQLATTARYFHSPSTLLPKSPSSAAPRSTLFICRLCQYRGHTLRGMRMHFKFHVSNHEPCSDEDIIVTSVGTVAQSPSTPAHSLLKCTICSAMFDHEETLLNHIRCVHTHERFLKCLECQSRFCSKWNLIRHMKCTHTNVTCDQHESSGSRNLATRPTEMRSADEDWPAEKGFSCPFCRSTFRNIEMLKQHVISYCPVQASTTDIYNDIRTKTANETFCSLCQISFQYKTSYDAHRLYYCPGRRTQNKMKLLA